MSDYILNDKTYFLNGTKIFVTNDDKSNGIEITEEWFLNQQDITILDVLHISDEVSGSLMYVKDKGWY